MTAPEEAGTRPVPDPTSLTTEALQREIAALKELMIERMDREASVYRERFKSVETQLELVERQRVEQKSDTAMAVSAALSAAKEAVQEQTTASERAIEKSETATIKSIDGLGEKFTTAFDGQRRETDGLKERLTSVEGQRQGLQETKQQQSVTLGQVIAAVGVAVALLGIFLAVAVALATQ